WKLLCLQESPRWAILHAYPLSENDMNSDKESNKETPGLLLVMSDIPKDLDEEYNRWYHEEHLAERLALPGFLSARRYRAMGSQPNYMVVYKCENIYALVSPQYREVLDNPTASTRHILPRMQN